ncbi:MAG: protein kinase domain-containing protein, partial [Planctomycetota bacterium]
MDDATRFQRLSQLFDAAIALEGPDRDRLLCTVEDPALRRELESMLAFDGRAPRTARPIVDIVGTLDETRRPVEIPKSIGGYRILGVVGQGAAGVVLKAVQPETDRTVALKVLASGLWNQSALARFRREIRLLGQLDHPSIARIYGAGTDTDMVPARPYLVMEYVEGLTLS